MIFGKWYGLSIIININLFIDMLMARFFNIQPNVFIFVKISPV